MSARSSSFRSLSSGATVTPSFQPAMSATAKAQWLPIDSAMRSPGFTPPAATISANAFARRSSSPNVRAPPSQTSASFSGVRRELASRRRAKFSATERLRRRSP